MNIHTGQLNIEDEWERSKRYIRYNCMVNITISHIQLSVTIQNVFRVFLQHYDRYIQWYYNICIWCVLFTLISYSTLHAVVIFCNMREILWWTSNFKGIFYYDWPCKYFATYHISSTGDIIITLHCVSHYFHAAHGILTCLFHKSWNAHSTSFMFLFWFMNLILWCVWNEF